MMTDEQLQQSIDNPQLIVTGSHYRYVAKELIAARATIAKQKELLTAAAKAIERHLTDPNNLSLETLPNISEVLRPAAKIGAAIITGISQSEGGTIKPSSKLGLVGERGPEAIMPKRPLSKPTMDRIAKATEAGQFIWATSHPDALPIEESDRRFALFDPVGASLVTDTARESLRDMVFGNFESAPYRSKRQNHAEEVRVTFPDGQFYVRATIADPANSLYQFEPLPMDGWHFHKTNVGKWHAFKDEGVETPKPVSGIPDPYEQQSIVREIKMNMVTSPEQARLQAEFRNKTPQELYEDQGLEVDVSPLTTNNVHKRLREASGGSTALYYIWPDGEYELAEEYDKIEDALRNKSDDYETKLLRICDVEDYINSIYSNVRISAGHYPMVSTLEPAAGMSTSIHAAPDALSKTFCGRDTTYWVLIRDVKSNVFMTAADSCQNCVQSLTAQSSK